MIKLHKPKYKSFLLSELILVANVFLQNKTKTLTLSFQNFKITYLSFQIINFILLFFPSKISIFAIIEAHDSVIFYNTCKS